MRPPFDNGTAGESGMPIQQLRRAQDLLADRALHGRLEPARQRELDQLLTLYPTLDDGSWERAAAALTLALMGSDGRDLPFDLRRQLEAR